MRGDWRWGDAVVTEIARKYRSWLFSFIYFELKCQVGAPYAGQVVVILFFFSLFI